MPASINTAKQEQSRQSVLILIDARLSSRSSRYRRLPEAAISPDEAQPKLASTTFVIGKDPLTPAAVRLIIKRTARRAADEHLVNLFGKELDAAIAALSTHSLRVGLTQDLFASGEDAGPIAQALRWTSTSTALRYGRKLAPSSNATARMLREVRR